MALGHKPQLEGNKRRRLFFLIVAVFNLVIYYPSLFHAVRADQIAYLADMAHTHDWFSLAVKFYAYNRVREFNPGDEITFRPVLYFVLGTEKWLFGYNFIYWQMTGLVLHLTVVWWLLKLLTEIHQSLFAPLLCLFFSTLFISMEMVVWHHLHGYELFVIFALAALYHFHAYLNEKQTDIQRFWVIAGYLLAASFTYEFGALLSAIFAVRLWVSDREQDPENGVSKRVKRLWALVLLVPCLVYFLVSAADFVARGTQAPEPPEIWSKMKILTTIENVVLANAWWLYGGIFPLELNVDAGDRIQIKPSKFFARHHSRTVGEWLLLLVPGLTAFLVYILVMLKGASIEHPKRRKRLAFLLISILIAYSLLIAVGRLNSRGLERVLTNNLYYSYMFWVFLVILIFSLVNFEIFKENRLSGLKLIAGGVLMTLIYVNGSLVHEMNWKMAAWSRPILLAIENMEEFKKPFWDEKGPPVPCHEIRRGNPVIKWLRKKGDPPDKKYTLLEVLYPEDCKGLSP